MISPVLVNLILSDDQLILMNNDIVFGTDGGNRILDIDIRSRWISNGSGIHTTANVGINIVNPTKPLDVDGSARIRSDLDVDGILYANSQLDVDGTTIIRDTLNVQNNVDFRKFIVLPFYFLYILSECLRVFKTISMFDNL